MEILRIKAFVKTAIDVSSRRIIFRYSAEEEISKTVNIKSNLKKQLKIEPVSYDINDRVKYNIETIADGREYQVVFKRVPGKLENFDGTLKLKTNYSEKPHIIIYLRGRIKK